MRYFQLDFLRGLMLIIMTIDHIESPFHRITLAPFGFFTSALGFVFLSGLVAGIVAQKKEAVPLKQLEKTFRNRAITIYRHHVITFTLLYLIGILFYYQGAQFLIFDGFGLESPFAPKMALGMVLLNKPRFLDILPMYFFFLLALPIIIQKIRKGKTLIIFICSGAIYLLAQVFDTYHIQQRISRDTLLELGYFDFLSWQFIFILGLILGTLFVKGHLSFLKSKKLLFFAAGVILVSTLIRRATVFQYIPSSEMGDMLADFAILNLSDLGQLNIIQLTNFLIFALLLFNLTQFNYISLSNKWFVLLGQHSLHVFTLHVFLAYFGLIIIEQFEGAVLGFSYVGIDFVVTFISIYLLFLFVHYRSKNFIKAKIKVKAS